jgi:hypothetical protein
MDHRIACGIALAFVLGGSIAIAQTPAPPNARVYIISPQDGASVESPFVARFGLSGMGIAPAGVEKPNTGHHHLLIDTDLPKMDEAIPADATHVHFGAGQTESEVRLPPGRHTLQLLLGDW